MILNFKLIIMKQILLFAFITIIALQSFSQTDPVRQKLDSVFQHVDKSQIPTGYLKEYGAEFMPLHWFNGVITDSNVVTNIDAFRFIYDDLATAKIQSALPMMPDLLMINTRIDSLRNASAASSVALLFGNYASLREDALSLNLFTISNQQIYDVPGRAQSPYQTNMVFAAASIIKEFANTVTFTYKPVLYFSNNNVTITELGVDFKDGSGYQVIPVNGTVSNTYYDSSGTKLIDFRAKLNTGAYVYCHSSVDVYVTNTGIAGRYAGNDPYAREVSIPVVPGEGLGDDVMQIRYSINNPSRTGAAPHLRKPLIYVEGYDVSGEYNIMNLIRQGSNTEKPGEWVNLAQILNGYDFMHYLDDVAGYDLVFVKYNTLRSFEDNSKMLQHVIEWVKADKTAGGSAEKNVVLGVSAGGVLARYTLARMTKYISPASTDTRLLITHDSPHQGANVPLAFQHFLYDLGNSKILGNKIKDKMDDLKNFYELNTKPATAQLLRARVIDDNGTVALNTFLNGLNSPYQQMVRFSSGDNQPTYRFVATAQGSQCGIPVMPSDGLPLADCDGEFAFVRFKLFYFPTPWKSKYFLKTQLNALPATNTSQIEYYKFSRRISYFGIGFGTKTIDEYNRTNPIGFTKWDAAPGSTQSIKDRTDGALNTGLTKQDVPWYGTPFLRIKAGLDMNITQDLFSFVSTTSALDAPVGTSLNTVYVFPLSGTANTSATEYIAQKKFTEMGSTFFNANHTDYTARNALWIYNEMENITQTYDCDDYCNGSSLAIQGDAMVCTISSSYSITNLPPNGSVLWTASPSDIATINSPDSSKTTITKNENGIITLTATLSNTCGDTPIVLSKNILVGASSTFTGLFGNYPQTAVVTTDDGSNDINSDEPTYVTFTSSQYIAPGDPSIQFSNMTLLQSSQNFPASPYRWQYIKNGSFGELFLYMPNSWAYFQFTLPNACGTDTFYLYFQASQRAYYKLSPNPAKDMVTVQIDEERLQKDKAVKSTDQDIREINIIDKMGNMLQRKTFGKGVRMASLNTSALKPDVYVIKISNGKTWKSLQLQKQ